MAKLIKAQPSRPTAYGEPFAGGAGAAIYLLVNEYVDEILINDLNPGVAAFWSAVASEPDALADRVERTKPTIELWHTQREIYDSAGEATDLELGFATFYLNRCNRSGILSARPIGGLDQLGKWKIDARFNAPELGNRIRRIGRFGERISVSRLDARDYLDNVSRAYGDGCLLYVDPPYLGQGEALYLSALSLQDHKEIARKLLGSGCRWLLTYDVDARVVSELYPDSSCLEFKIAHTAAKQHVGFEYMVFADSVVVPSIEVLPDAEAVWVSRAVA